MKRTRIGARPLALALVVGCASAARLPAQGAPLAVDQYVTLRGTDTLATERVEREGRSLRSVLVRRAERLQFALHLDRGVDERVDSLAMDVRFVGSDTVFQRASVRLEGDTARLRIAQGSAAPRSLSVASRADALPFVNLAVPTYEQIVRRARALGLDGAADVRVPVFLPEGARTVTATLRRLGADSVLLTLGAEMRLAVAPDGRVLGAVVPAQGLCIVRPPAPCAVRAPIATDYAAPAGAPYDAVDATITGSGGARLAGTLTLPRTRGADARVPAVLLLTGSGAQDRDEAIPGIPGYRPFRQLADTLSRRGIAVLRLDDRGVGGSAVGTEQATLEVLARDAARAIAWLRARPEVRADRVAIVGHSEGGIVATMVASQDSSLAAIALLAAPARTGRRVSDYQIRHAVALDPSIAPAARDSAAQAAIAMRDALAATDPQLRIFLDHDPAPRLRGVRAPVLIVQGETDRQVTADQAAELEAHLRAGGNRDVTRHVIPRTNHLLLEDSSGEVAGYAALPSKAVHPALLGLVADWLVTRTH